MSQNGLDFVYYLFGMNRNNYSSSFKWDAYQSYKPSSSLIIAPNHLQPFANSLNSTNKHRLDDLLPQKSNGVHRYSSEDEFKRFHQRSNNMVTSDIHQRREEDRSNISPHEKVGNWQNVRKGLQKQAFVRGRDSNRKGNMPSTYQSELLAGNRSQKALPSFLRNQAKSPEKVKSCDRSVVSKQQFKILKRLGEGKFGSVFLARQIYTGMLVALKVMPKRKIIQDNIMVQFIREMKIQTFLDHPNIIKNYGFFSDEENIYTIMELGCDGQLYDLIATGTKLTEESTSYIIGNLLEAVNVMHKHKILHRDIKPQNIVLVLGNVKLCDFGWAVNKKEELRSTFCGTPLYLSPELLQGSRYDEKVDLWAVGILAYELHLGSSPFNISEQEDLVKIITDEVQFPAKKGISKEFKLFIHQILKKNPKERMSCHQLLSLDFIHKYLDIQTCEELCQ